MKPHGEWMGPPVKVRIPVAQITRIDNMATILNLTRSEMIRQLLDLGRTALLDLRPELARDYD
jgi:hypothetical protein